MREERKCTEKAAEGNKKPITNDIVLRLLPPETKILRHWEITQSEGDLCRQEEHTQSPDFHRESSRDSVESPSQPDASPSALRCECAGSESTVETLEELSQYEEKSSHERRASGRMEESVYTSINGSSGKDSELRVTSVLDKYVSNSGSKEDREDEISDHSRESLLHSTDKKTSTTETSLADILCRSDTTKTEVCVSDSIVRPCTACVENLRVYRETNHVCSTYSLKCHTGNPAELHSEGRPKSIHKAPTEHWDQSSAKFHGAKSPESSPVSSLGPTRSTVTCSRHTSPPRTGSLVGVRSSDGTVPETSGGPTAESCAGVMPRLRDGVTSESKSDAAPGLHGGAVPESPRLVAQLSRLLRHLSPVSSRRESGAASGNQRRLTPQPRR